MLVTVRFDGQVKLGIIGRIAAAWMGRDGRIDAILERYREHLTASGLRLGESTPGLRDPT